MSFYLENAGFFNYHNVQQPQVDSIASGPCGAETAKIRKTAPQIPAQNPKKSRKKQLKPQKSAKQHPKLRQKTGKEQKKVAETAEIPKTAIKQMEIIISTFEDK